LGSLLINPTRVGRGLATEHVRDIVSRHQVTGEIIAIGTVAPRPPG
jgi:hypothetical protein